MTKMRFKIIVLAVLILSVSCKTPTYLMPSLPEFNPVRPIRPTLKEVEQEVPMEAVVNTVRLMEYSRQMESYADSWETFYEELRNEVAEL